LPDLIRFALGSGLRIGEITALGVWSPGKPGVHPGFSRARRRVRGGTLLHTSPEETKGEARPSIRATTAPSTAPSY
jgi:hypothetical protein